MSDISFNADAETMRILDGLKGEDRSAFINAALKDFATKGGVTHATASNVSQGPLAEVQAEVRRLLGANPGIEATLLSGEPQIIRFLKSDGSPLANLELGDCQAILKSLRPPITQAEVVEMLMLMSC